MARLNVCFLALREINNSSTTTEKIEILEKSLHQAGRASIPKYRVKSEVKPTGKAIWNKEISETSRKSKEAYAKYKNSQGDENLKQEMVNAKRQLRSAQRRAYASQRINHAEKIMQSSQNDTKLFHQLIKRQRRNNHSIDKMIFKGDEYDDTEGILEGWWSYFTDLFGNSDQGNFDTEKIELAKIQNVITEDLERDRVPIEKVSEEEVIKAIKKNENWKVSRQ